MNTSVFFRALKWSMAGELASRVIQPLVFVILARLLTPEDYGVMAAAVMVISFTQIFWDAGMGKALVQRQKDTEEAANVAFWVNLGLGIIICVALFLLSDRIAEILFQDIRVSNVLKVMTIQVLLGALGSVHTALLQKELKFNTLFWVRIFTVAIPGLISIPLALGDLSYWALVIGTVAGQAAQVVILWQANPWRPKFTFNTTIAPELISFASWVGLSGLLAWFYIWIDSLFVGSYLGTRQLGLFRTGNQFVIMIFGFLFAPLLPVLYSHLSNIQAERDQLKNWFEKVLRIITFISIPLAFLLFSLANEVEATVFGSKWEGVGFVIAVMGLMHGYSWVTGANGEVYRAIGKPSYETTVNIITAGIYLIGYYISIQRGFQTFVWTRLGLAIGAMFLHMIFGWLAIRLSITLILRTILVATAIGLVSPGVNMLIPANHFHPFVRILIVSTGSVILMGGLLFLFERNGVVKDLFSVIKKRMLAR